MSDSPHPLAAERGPASAPDTPPPVGRGWRGCADLFGTAAIASMLIVGCLWLYNQGIQTIADGDWPTSLGKLTGLLASNLMLLQVLMMARIPWVERAWGHDLLTRRHRLVGFASFWLMLLHIVLITIGYAGHQGISPLVMAGHVLVRKPGMLLALGGTVALIAVVALSIRAARRRLRYESWHLLHLYAYLGMGLALPHQIWTGHDFEQVAAQVYWWTIWGAAAAATVVFRVGLPLWRSAYHRLRVVSVVPETDGVVSVLIAGRGLNRLRARAGQFFFWRFRDGPGWSRANPYSLSAAPTADGLRITVRAVGDGSARLARLGPGTRVLIEGPYGTLTADRQLRPKVALFAAGVGITPLRALLEELRFEPGHAALLYRISDQTSAIFVDELRDLAERRGVVVHYLTGPRRRATSWLPAGGRFDTADEQVLLRVVPDVAAREVYICGPPAWMAAARAACRHAGTPSHHIHLEDFSW